MIKDQTQNQKSGDNSSNYQAGTINQYGLSYSEVKEVALDVFKAHFASFSDRASQMAKERAEEVLVNFLNKIKEENPKLLNSVQEPSMQNALYNAQKGYAISGEKEIASMLVDLLVERSKLNRRNLLQIVLEESLEVISKLTIQHLDILSIIFLLKYDTEKEFQNLDDLLNYLDQRIEPFIESLTKEDTVYKHLVYCNCGSLIGDQVLVFSGFNLAINSFLIKVPEFHSIFANSAVPPKEERDKIKSIFIEKRNYLERLFDVNSEISEFTLTPVGIALALANIKRKTEVLYDLTAWVK